MGETKTFKVFQRITRKSYHRKRISLRFHSRRREAPESRERTFEAIGKLFVLIGHSYCLNFAPATRDASPRREAEDYPAEKLRVYASFASTFTANGIMHERTQGGLAESDNELVLVHVFTARKLPRPLANFPFKINANGDEAKRELVY